MKRGVKIFIIVFLLLFTLSLMFYINASQFGDGGPPIKIPEDYLKDEVNKLFSEENAIVIYPGTRYVKIKQGDTDEIGLGIKNLDESEKYFSYNVFFYDKNSECKLDSKIIEDWIKTGKSEKNLLIQPKDISAQRVLFEIPNNAPLCIMRFKVNVMDNINNSYSDFFDVRIE